MPTARREIWRSRWFMPAFSVFLGLLMLGAFLVEVAQGEDGQPWSQLGAVGGIAYIISVAVLRARS